MKVRSSNSVNKVRQAVLAGIFTLTGSAGAMAAVPASPVIDWIDASVQSNEDGPFIEIDLGWSRYDLEDVTTVQYRVDGKPVLSRGFDAIQDFGDANFAITDEGDFDLTVALCNVEGCGESALMKVSVSDSGEVTVSIEERPVPPEWVVVSGDRDELAPIGPDTSLQLQLTGLDVTPAGLGTALMTQLGKAALGGVARGGSAMAFNAIMKAIGLGGDDVGAQISELKSSINALNTRIGQLTDEIEGLKDETVWQGFIQQHTRANLEVNAIYTNFKSVTGWLDAGISPDTDGWTKARGRIEDAVSALAGSDLNPGKGIVDMRDGAIYQLMNAIPQRAASVESYWTIVDEYRDYYRAAIAIGFLALDLIEDNFDTSGTTRIIADNALEAGQIAVENMYAYGIAPERPRNGADVMDFVQLRWETTGYASAEYAVLDDTATLRLSGPALRTWIQNLVSEYRPAHHDGQTLEEFLIDSGVPTAYFLDSSNGWESSGWQLNMVKDAVPHMDQPPLWEVRPRVIQIKGNNAEETYVSLCPANPDLCNGSNSDAWYVWYNVDTGGTPKVRQEIRDKIAARKNAVRANGGFTLQNGNFAESYYATIDLNNRLSHSGRAANLDAGAVRIAAFGDGAATLAAGQLPGPDGTSACIGLPSENLTLLAAGDYALQWRTNGNLVLRNGESGNQWTTATYNWGEKLCFMPKGNLLVMQGSQVFWSSDTGDGALGGYGGRQLKLFQDGALQIVNELSDVIWQVGPFE